MSYMTTQEQIAHLAAAMQEAGIMPEWMHINPDTLNHVESRNKGILAALCGVAAEFLSGIGIVVESAHGGFAVFKYSSHGTVEHAFNYGEKGEIYSSENLCGVMASFDTYPETLAAAVKIAKKGDGR